MILSGEILRPALPLISFEHTVTVVVLTSFEELQVWFAGPDSGACHVAYLFGGTVLELTSISKISTRQRVDIGPPHKHCKKGCLLWETPRPESPGLDDGDGRHYSLPLGQFFLALDVGDRMWSSVTSTSSQIPDGMSQQCLNCGCILIDKRSLVALFGDIDDST
jgi:hypothetical protein